MNIKDSLILVTFSLFLGVMMFGRSTPGTQLTPEPTEQSPDPLNVQGQTALFIGDSHTANHQFGWQTQLCQRTGMIMKNVSVGGKTTDWMLNQGVYAMNDGIDHLFIYGGANDMYSGKISPEGCLDNIQRLVNLGKGRNSKVYVITGFDPMQTVTVNNPGYKKRYARLQELMLTGLKGCQVIDTRMSVNLTDCGDGLCHMKKSGHTKMALKIVETLHLKTLQP
jgi:hypothetical protein